MPKTITKNMASELKIECDENKVGAPVPPLSPLSNVYLKLLSPKSEEVMHCAMSFRDPIDVEAFKKDVSNSLLIKHPRFRSLLIRDHTGEHWKTTSVNVDDHIIVHHNTAATSQLEDNNNDDDDDEDGINAFLAEITVSTPLSENKPLWEMHVLLGLKCVVLRVHHALGDGVSLMSLLFASFAKKSDGGNNKNKNNAIDHSKMKNNHNNHTTNAKINININNKGDDRRTKGVVGWLLKSLWFTLVNLIKVLGRFLWVKDERSVISGGDGVELLPRKLVTAKFLVDDLKSIKTIIPQVSVNDVLLGIISSGLSKYLNAKSPLADLKQAHQFNAIIPVNIRKESYIQDLSDLMSINTNGVKGWGNKTSAMLLPIRCCNDLRPLDHVKAMKATMDTKKHYSFEAYYLFKLGVFLVKFFSAKVVSSCFRRAMLNTTICISNVGRVEAVMIGGNLVTQIRAGISCNLQAITIHMISYAGTAYLQVMVAKDIVPDPEMLINFFQESFLEIKNLSNQDIVANVV